MRIYQGGPMRGYDMFNYQAFEDGMLFLREMGHEVVSPHEIDMERGWVDAEWIMDGDRRVFTRVDLTSDEFPMELAMRHDIETILSCDAVSFLPRWQRSQGSQVEGAVAHAIGLPIYEHVPPHKFEGSFEKADG